MRDELGVGRGGAVFAAVSAAAALLLGGRGFAWSLAALPAAALLYLYIERSLGGESLAACLPRGILVGELLFLVAAMAKAASLASLCWSAGGEGLLFSFALLGLAAAGATYGGQSVLRAAVVFAWTCAVFYAILLGSTAIGTTPRLSIGAPRDALASFAVLLSAMSALFLPASGSRGIRLWGGIGAVMAAVLYVAWGKGGEVSLLTAVKSAELLGTFRRFEALASCALTIGLYQLLAILAAAAIEMQQRLAIAHRVRIFLPAAALLPVIGRVPDGVWAAAIGIFWGAIPLLSTRFWGAKKDAKNIEKR